MTHLKIPEDGTKLQFSFLPGYSQSGHQRPLRPDCSITFETFNARSSSVELGRAIAPSRARAALTA
jgi:hypothetical protein